MLFLLFVALFLIAATALATLASTTYLGINFGIMFFTVAISSFVGPRIAAVVADANDGSFSKAFLIAAALSVVGLALLGAHALLRRRAPSAVSSSPLMTGGPSIEE